MLQSSPVCVLETPFHLYEDRIVSEKNKKELCILISLLNKLDASKKCFSRVLTTLALVKLLTFAHWSLYQ